MSVDQIKQQVRDFLTGHFRNHVVQDDEDIFALGFVNSLFAMQIVMFLEQRFAVTVENDDLDIDNFRTINAITNLTAGKLGLPV